VPKHTRDGSGHSASFSADGSYLELITPSADLNDRLKQIVRIKIEAFSHRTGTAIPLVGERRCRWTEALHRTDIRHRRLKNVAVQIPAGEQSTLRILFATQPDSDLTGRGVAITP
jgi:hypothetical protein